MHPQICQIGPVVIYAYGLMLSLAFIISSTLTSIEAKKNGIQPDTIFNLCFLVFIFGIIGARLLYVLENLSYYSRFPLEIIMLQHGGLSWYGGFACGTICGIAYVKKRKLALYKILDLVAPYLALGQAIGRIGCLLNGCCFGKVSRFGLYFETQDHILIPTQIYSSLILLFIFVILRFTQNRPHKDCQIFLLYLILYASKRFLIEFWRADNPVIFAGLTLFQLISLAVFVLGATKLLILTKKTS